MKKIACDRPIDLHQTFDASQLDGRKRFWSLLDILEDLGGSAPEALQSSRGSGHRSWPANAGLSRGPGDRGPCKEDAPDSRTSVGGRRGRLPGPSSTGLVAKMTRVAIRADLTTIDDDTKSRCRCVHQRLMNPAKSAKHFSKMHLEGTVGGTSDWFTQKLIRQPESKQSGRHDAD